MNRNAELEVWNDLASDYSKWIDGGISERGRLLHETLLKSIRDVCPRQASAVVDIGCGDGRIARELFADTGATVIGVDGSEKMLAQAKSCFPRMTTIKAALDSQMPILSSSADVVLCTMALMYAERIELVLSEIERILIPTGMALIAVPHPCFFNRRGTLENFDYWESKCYAKYLDPVFRSPVLQFHRPLSAYISAFRAARLMLETLIETRISPEPATDELRLHYKMPCHAIFVLKRTEGCISISETEPRL